MKRVSVYSSVSDAVSAGYTNYVICDVFRASSSIIIACSLGAKVRPFALPEDAIQASTEGVPIFLAGEKNGNLPHGFSLSNSPTEWRRTVGKGDSIHFVSSSGTVAMCQAAERGGDVIIASFLNAASISQYIAKDYKKWAIISCGSSRGELRLEDAICSDLIKSVVDHMITVDDLKNAIEKNVSIIRNLPGARFVIERGAGDDIDYICQNVCTFDIVPKLVDRWIYG